MGFLSGLFGGDAGNAALKATKKNASILTGLNTYGQNVINTGEAKSGAALDRAVEGFTPYTTAGAAATNLYSDALGLNGAGGTGRATSAFTTSPGYDFALDQGTQAALRGASAAGMLNSGNTLTALTEFGQGTANKEYGSWLDRLAGASAQGLSAAGGQAGALGGVADLYQGTAGDRLGLASSVAQGRMGNNNQMAQIQEQQAANKGGFFGKLLSGGLSLGTKLATGGLF